MTSTHTHIGYIVNQYEGIYECPNNQAFFIFECSYFRLNLWVIS